MKFYKMKNGDIVTALHISTARPNAIRATRLYDATHKTYCCQRRVYYDGVAERLNKAQVAVFTGQLNTTLRQSTDEDSIQISSKLDTVMEWSTSKAKHVAKIATNFGPWKRS